MGVPSIACGRDLRVRVRHTCARRSRGVLAASMADRMGESWDDVHAGRDPAKGVEPHPAVVDTVRGLAVGTALDVGCGDGVNLVWLAAQGWDVTGVDASRVGLERAAARAESAGVADRV